MKLKRFVFLADSFVNYKLIKISNFQEIDGSKCRSDIENDATPGTSSGKVQKAIDLQQNQLLWKNAYKMHFPEEKELVWEELSQKHKFTAKELQSIFQKSQKSLLSYPNRKREIPERLSVFAFLLESEDPPTIMPQFLREDMKLCGVLQEYEKIWKNPKTKSKETSEEYKKLAVQLGESGKYFLQCFKVK